MCAFVVLCACYQQQMCVMHLCGVQQSPSAFLFTISFHLLPKALISLAVCESLLQAYTHCSLPTEQRPLDLGIRVISVCSGFTPSLFFYLFLSFFSFLHLFTEPRLETLICIFMGRCTVQTQTTGESLFPADFSDANTILVDPPKTGLIMHHSDCRFVFLFVIRIGDDSGRRQWEAQQGAQTQ